MADRYKDTAATESVVVEKKQLVRKNQAARLAPKTSALDRQRTDAPFVFCVRYSCLFAGRKTENTQSDRIAP
jgi:hypothetical protein